MRCYYVLVHGRLSWRKPNNETEDTSQPAGFYCHRYVLAQDEKQASEKAFHRVTANLDRQSGWLKTGDASVQLEAEAVKPAATYKLLRPDNRGHSFYERE